MQSSIKLARDCPAVQIPAGVEVLLPAGTEVGITQTLGGSYTVSGPGGLYRIGSGDADALGLNGPPQAEASSPGATSTSGPLEEKAVWNVLKNCYDPEIPVNIVDLGLVYDLAIDPLPAGKSRVSVKMTLTAPGCGMGSVIAGDAQQRILELPGVEDALVQVVWDPPWHPSMISPEGRRVLGLDS